MARIPDVEIERLKRETSLERLVTGFGIELRKHVAPGQSRLRGKILRHIAARGLRYLTADEQEPLRPEDFNCL